MQADERFTEPFAPRDAEVVTTAMVRVMETDR
jgi:hypothetical protein